MHESEQCEIRQTQNAAGNGMPKTTNFLPQKFQ